MMASNDDAYKKQKREAIDGGSSSVSSILVGTASILSLETVLKEFPDFLFLVLPYIADRLIWNSIASCNKAMYKQSKAILPPWPRNYRLTTADLLSWSPCSTRIACAARIDFSVYYQNVVIYDQRRAPLRLIARDEAVVTDLKFSPDGSFIVLARKNGFVTLWDNVTGTYEQLQEWDVNDNNIQLRAYPNQGRDYPVLVSVSPCSKLILAVVGTDIFLKDVKNGGKTIKSMNLTPKGISSFSFSSDGCAVFIFQGGRVAEIKVWYPYLDDGHDEDSLVTIWRATNLPICIVKTIEFLYDNTMIAIYDRFNSKETLWSIDMDHNRLTQKPDFPDRRKSRSNVTPGGKYIVYWTRNGPKSWSIAGNMYSSKTIHFSDNVIDTNYDLAVRSFAPNNRQLLIHKLSGDLYIRSYFVK